MRLQEFRLEITDCVQCPSIIEVDARVITLQEVQHSQVIKEVRIGGGLKGRAVQSIFLGAQRPQPPSPLPTYTGPQARQAHTIVHLQSLPACHHQFDDANPIHFPHVGSVTLSGRELEIVRPIL